MSTLEASSGVSVVQLSGRLALGNVLQSTEDRLRALIRHSNGKIVLDLSGVDYCDSAGIGMIMACAGVARDIGGELRLAGITPRVRKLVSLTQVDRLLPVYPTTDHALREF